MQVSINSSLKNSSEKKKYPNMAVSYKKSQRQNKQNIQNLHRSLFLRQQKPSLYHLYLDKKNRKHVQSSNNSFNNSIKGQHRRYEGIIDNIQQLSQYDHQNKNDEAQIFNYHNKNESVTQVIKQLTYSHILAIFHNFQQCFEQQVNQMLNKFLSLEFKIAEMQKKFNMIQINLHKKSKQIVTVLQQNRVLIDLNRDIQTHMEQLRTKYEMSFYNLKNQWMSAKIQEFRSQLHQFKVVSKQCQSCRVGIKQRLRKQLAKIQQNLNLSNKKQVKNKVANPIQLKIDSGSQLKNHNQNSQLLNKQQRGIIKQTLKQIVQMLYNSDQRQDMPLNGWRQKLLQNIDLKFEVIQLLSEQRIKNNIIQSAMAKRNIEQAQQKMNKQKGQQIKKQNKNYIQDQFL